MSISRSMERVVGSHPYTLRYFAVPSTLEKSKVIELVEEVGGTGTIHYLHVANEDGIPVGYGYIEFTNHEALIACKRRKSIASEQDGKIVGVLFD
jgi:hypothetical protein